MEIVVVVAIVAAAAVLVAALLRRVGTIPHGCAGAARAPIRPSSSVTG